MVNRRNADACGLGRKGEKADNAGEAPFVHGKTTNL
jgi:hypothetical protein